jgi:hypothetical protein
VQIAWRSGNLRRHVDMAVSGPVPRSASLSAMATDASSAGPAAKARLPPPITYWPRARAGRMTLPTSSPHAGRATQGRGTDDREILHSLARMPPGTARGHHNYPGTGSEAHGATQHRHSASCPDPPKGGFEHRTEGLPDLPRPPTQGLRVWDTHRDRDGCPLMAGHGPAPKPDAERRRRNKVAPIRQLSPANAPIRPQLPTTHEWKPQTVDYWSHFWESPMAGEVEASDVDELLMLARVVDDFWSAESPSARKELLVEIRLQGARFGKTPIDRSRLKWEIDRGEEASTRARARRQVDRSAAADPRTQA